MDSAIFLLIYKDGCQQSNLMLIFDFVAVSTVPVGATDGVESNHFDQHSAVDNVSDCDDDGDVMKP